MLRTRKCGNLAIASEELWLNLGIEVGTLDIPSERIVDGGQIALGNLLIDTPTLVVVQERIKDVGTAEVAHSQLGVLLNIDIERIGSPTRVGTVCEIVHLGRVVDILLLAETKLLDILLDGNPHNLYIVVSGVELCHLCIGAAELLRNLVILLDGEKAICRGIGNSVQHLAAGDWHTYRAAAIESRKEEWSPRIVIGDNRCPRDIRVSQNPRQLRMVGTLLKVETIGLGAEEILDDACTEQSATIVGLTIHIDIHGLGVEGARKVELTAFVDAHCVVEHLWCSLLQRVECLARELKLSLEVGMLVHKGQEVVVYNGKIAPQGGANIAVIVHITVQNIAHIDALFCRFVARLSHRNATAENGGKQGERE